MINEQTIFLDDIEFDISRPSIVQPGTSILNLIQSDLYPTGGFRSIGGIPEWIPLMWLEYERDKIDSLQKLRIISLEGTFSDWVEDSVKASFKNVEVEIINIPNFGNWIFKNLAKIKAKEINEHEKTDAVIYSAGTMRLNRTVLLEWCQENFIENIAYPTVNPDQLHFINNEYKSVSNLNQTPKLKLEGKRFFDDIDVHEFNDKFCDLLCKTYINFVATSPDYGLRLGFLDEKTWYPIACKTIPFFVGNVNENENIQNYGFKPYVGFDYSGASVNNPIDRWKKILNDNKQFFVDIGQAEEIYSLNKEIIQFNFDRLTTVDWEKTAYDQFNRQDPHIKDLVRTHANRVYKLFSIK